MEQQERSAERSVLPQNKEKKLRDGTEQPLGSFKQKVLNYSKKQTRGRVCFSSEETQRRGVPFVEAENTIVIQGDRLVRMLLFLFLRFFIKGSTTKVFSIAAHHKQRII